MGILLTSFKVLALIVCLWPQSVVGPTDYAFYKFVPKELHKCCLQDHLKSPCNKIDAAVRGGDGKFYLFFEDHFITIPKFQANGYPLLSKTSFAKIDGNWGTLKATASDPVKAGLLTIKNKVRTLSLKQGQTYYQFIDGNKPQGTPDTVCANHHPLFCHQPDKLEAATIFHRTTGKKLALGVYKRDSTSFDIKGFAGSTPQLDIQNIKGSLNAIGVYGKDTRNGDDLGVYFTRNHSFCFFRQAPSKALSRDLFKDIDHPLPLPFIRCWDLQIFFGCPQNTCWRPDMDAIALLRPQRNGGLGSKLMVEVFRGPYVWETEYGRPPLPQLYFYNHFLLEEVHSHPQYLKYIDAAVTLPDPNSVDGTNFNKPIPSDQAKDLTYMFKGGMVKVLNNESGKKSLKIEELFPGMPSPVDAAWFNSKLTESLMFLFKGSDFWTFKMISRKDWDIVWVPQGPEGGKKYIGDKLHGLPADIDGVFAFDVTAYIVKEHWFYQITQDDWDINGRAEDVYKPQAVIGVPSRGGNQYIGLIKAQDHCLSKKDVPKRRETIESYPPLALPKVRPPDETTTTTTPYTGSSTGPGGSPIITGGSGSGSDDNKTGINVVAIVAVIVGVIVLLLALAAIVLYFMLSKGSVEKKKRPLRPLKNKGVTGNKGNVN